MFVATNIYRGKRFVTTKICLWRQNFCRDKRIFVATKDVVCRDKHVNVFEKFMSLVTGVDRQLVPH